MDWLQHVVDYGTPLVVLILFARMAAQAAHWFAEHIVLPLRDAWISHLAVLDAHMEKQTQMLCEILERVGE